MKEKSENTSVFWQKVCTVFEAEVGGINNVKPPSIHNRLWNIVAGLGARYLVNITVS